MKRFASFVLGAALLTVPSLAGPVFLTGHDPDFHSQDSAGARNLFNVGLSFVTGGTYNGGVDKFLWVESQIAPPSGHRIGKLGLNAIGLSEGVHFDSVDAAGLPGVNFANYSAIAIASSFGGLLTRAELDALIARTDDIKTFINAGGGLLALSECFPCGANLLAGSSAPSLFGYLPIAVSSVFNNPPYTVTPYGASLGLTNADVNDPSHNAFASAAGLNIVDLDIAGNPMTLAGIVRVNGGFEPVPEPSSALLLAGGAGLLLLLRSRL